MQHLPAMGSKYVYLILASIAATALIGCGPAGTGQSHTAGSGIITNPETEMYKPEPLLWEGQAKDGILWSAFVYQIIGAEVAPSLLPGTDDIQDFCPGYPFMKEAQKVNFWAYLISAIAKYETGFNPNAQDENGEIDEQTGKLAYLQGLMHLSFKQIRNYAFCVFDQGDDGQSKPSGSGKLKGLFDPLRNLDCGIKILATQIDNHGKISASGSEWKSLQPSGRGSHLREIQASAKALPFCKRN